MAAIAVYLGLLAYLSCVGLAACALATRRIDSVGLLVSPAVGLGVMLPLVLTFNRAGAAVSDFSGPLVAVLLLLSAAVLWLRRPAIDLRPALAAAPGVFGVVLLTLAPLLAYGFHWLAFGNDDMLDYVMSAERFMGYGFFHVPDLSTIVGASNVPQDLWFLQVVPPNRYGADVFVAMVASALHLSAIQAYMPVCVAAFAAIAMAVAATAIAGKWGARVATIAPILCVLVLPLTLYSVVAQLAPQLWGVACAAALIATVQADDAGIGGPVPRGVMLGGIASAFLLIYPELMPVPVLAIGLYALVGVLRRRVTGPEVRAGATAATVMTGALLLLLNVQIFTVAATFRTLFGVGSSLHFVAFGLNYYLIPSGVANLFGFVPLSTYPADPAMSVAILAGFALLAVAIGAAAGYTIRGDLAATMALTTFGFCALLFATRNGYGLFKMAFVVQPFLAVVITIVIARWAERLAGGSARRATALAATTVTAAFAATCFTSYQYLAASGDVYEGSDSRYVSLVGGSHHDIVRELSNIAATARKADPPGGLVSDSAILQLAVLEGMSFRGLKTSFEAFDPFANLVDAAVAKRGGTSSGEDIVGWPAGVRARGQRLAQDRMALFARPQFTIDGTSGGVHVSPLKLETSRNVGAQLLVETGPRQTVLNRSSVAGTFDVRIVPFVAATNWLALVDSDYGHPSNLLVTPNTVALGKVEPDFFDKASSMSSTGRTMLLEVLHPTDTVSLRIAMTATHNPDGERTLPDVTVVGRDRTVARSYGSGSARVVTRPVRPLLINGRAYLLVKFGSRLVRFHPHRTGLMLLYGADVNLDIREFSVFTRDISAVVDPRLAPIGISSFPRDLLARDGPIYSGLYEDGWMSDAFAVKLRAPSRANVLTMRFAVPPGPDRKVTIEIDGRVRSRSVGLASHYLSLDVRGVGPGDHLIAIRSSGSRPIGPHDSRRAWGLLQSLAFSAE